MTERKGIKKSKKLNSEKKINEAVLKNRKKHSAKPPVDLFRNFDVDEIIEGGCKEYRLVPKKDFNGTYFFYLYGGANCLNIEYEQWEFITNLAEKTNCGVFVPIYPIAPEHTCEDTFNMLEKAYDNATKGRDVEKIILIGDSTGAGLALSLAMLAWKEGYKKPDTLIMLSPVIDIEMFDSNMEAEVLNHMQYEDRFFFNQALKNYLNNKWVKNYATKIEYTSSYYGDYTDICDDIVVFTGVDDMFNCYARGFYRKAKNQGVNIRLYEFNDANHDFMIYSKNRSSENAHGYLVDVINETYKNSLYQIYPLKKLAEWSKRYPDIIKDEWAVKFIYSGKIGGKDIKIKQRQYRNYVTAARYAACDSLVSTYIKEYPDCTIVRFGCELDNMFARLDNGRIKWYSVGTHNIMSVRRSIYGDSVREKTIGRSMMDLTWLDDVKCNQNKGIMFVCNGNMNKLSKHEMKHLICAIADKFPGSELVFTSETVGAGFFENISNRKIKFHVDKIKSCVNDAHALFSSWRADLRLKSEEPVAKYFPTKKDFKFMTKLHIKYNLMTYNHKVIRLKLGSEKYEV